MIAVLTILVPIIAAIALLVIPNRSLDRIVALASTVLTFILALGVSGSQIVTSWLPSLGLNFALDGSGASSLLVICAGLVMIPTVLYASMRIEKNTTSFLSLLLLMQAGLNGIFLASDLVLFYVFWEVTLIPSLLMLAGWGREGRKQAMHTYLIYAIAGSLLMLVSILAIKPLSGATSYLFSDLMAATPSLPVQTQIWIFLGFTAAFAVKLPLVPLHGWLIGFHTQNHESGVADVAGTLYKVGAFGFFAWALPLLPDGAAVVAPILLVFAAITAVYAAWLATAQEELKSLLAYASLSHMGIIGVGLFGLHITGLNGAMYLLAAQMLSTGALFLLSGMLYERKGSFELNSYGGLAKSAPLFASVFLIVLFASIGVPGLSNFPGEFLSLMGAFQQNMYFGILAALAVIIAGVYGVNLYQRLFQEEERSPISEMTAIEMALLAPLIVMIIYLGVFPNASLKHIETQAQHVAVAHEASFDYVPVAAGTVIKDDAHDGGSH